MFSAQFTPNSVATGLNFVNVVIVTCLYLRVSLHSTGGVETVDNVFVKIDRSFLMCPILYIYVLVFVYHLCSKMNV